MKKAAKILSLILVVMTVLIMAACGKKETPVAEPEPAAAQENAKEETSAAEQEPATLQDVKEEMEATVTATEEPKKEESVVADIIGTYKGQIDHTDELSADYEEHLGFALDEPIYMDVYLELNHLPQRCPFALKPPTQTTYPRGVPLRYMDADL